MGAIIPRVVGGLQARAVVHHMTDRQGALYTHTKLGNGSAHGLLMADQEDEDDCGGRTTSTLQGSAKYLMLE